MSKTINKHYPAYDQTQQNGRQDQAGQESGPEAENQPKEEQDLARKVDYVLDHVYLWVGSVAQANSERRGSAR